MWGGDGAKPSRGGMKFVYFLRPLCGGPKGCLKGCGVGMDFGKALSTLGGMRGACCELIGEIRINTCWLARP